MNKKKQELISIIVRLNERNKQLEEQMAEMEKLTHAHFALWEEDENGDFRCQNCHTKAPKAKGIWGGTVQWKTDYCMICGCRMVNGEKI